MESNWEVLHTASIQSSILLRHLLTSVLHARVVFSVSNSVLEAKVLRCLRKMLQADEVRFLKVSLPAVGQKQFCTVLPLGIY